MSAVILDRDGVINKDSPLYIKSPEEWHPIEGSLEAIALLNQKGYKVFVATNQSGLARGFFDEATLTSIHEKMKSQLAELEGVIEDIVYCPHMPDEDCVCRKPEPGMLLTLAERHSLDLNTSAFVGDSLKDIEAALAVGALPQLVLTGNGQKTLESNPKTTEGVSVYKNLLDFATKWPVFSN